MFQNRMSRNMSTQSQQSFGIFPHDHFCAEKFLCCMIPPVGGRIANQLNPVLYEGVRMVCVVRHICCQRFEIVGFTCRSRHSPLCNSRSDWFLFLPWLEINAQRAGDIGFTCSTLQKFFLCFFFGPRLDKITDTPIGMLSAKCGASASRLLRCTAVDVVPEVHLIGCQVALTPLPDGVSTWALTELDCRTTQNGRSVLQWLEAFELRLRQTNCQSPPPSFRTSKNMHWSSKLCVVLKFEGTTV